RRYLCLSLCSSFPHASCRHSRMLLAGIQCLAAAAPPRRWIPAFAGMTSKKLSRPCRIEIGKNRKYAIEACELQHGHHRLAHADQSELLILAARILKALDQGGNAG